MGLLEAILLGLVQGLTEFVPVSSSGHLLLMHHLLGVQAQALSFDVALHIGTLAALLIMFHRDVVVLVRGLVTKGPQARLAKVIALATIPAILAGLFLQDLAESTFRSPLLVAVTLSLAGLLMLVAERYAHHRQQQSDVQKTSMQQGAIIGLAQAVALVPGVSRSGSTITAGLFAGLDRVAATRFSFLLSIPITAGAILKVLADGSVGAADMDPVIFIAGITTAFVSGLVAIRFLLRFVARHSLKLFAYYRLILAAAIVFLMVVID